MDNAYSANSSAVLNTWTHLVGVYDATAQQVNLYVNGVAQTSGSHTAPFNATGPLQVGRVKEFGSLQVGTAGQVYWGPWAGRVDEVRVFRYALGPQEVYGLYNNVGSVNVTGDTLGVPGALQGAQQGQTSSTALAFSSDARNSYNPTSYNNPTTYSQECWFRATSYVSNGRTLMGFGPVAVGNSSSDRRLFLNSSGNLVAGTNSGTSGIAQTSGTYIDQAWHHAVVTVSPGTGINLYVDGALAASAAYAAPSNITGYWRMGGDTSSGTWPADYLWYGQLDEVAVYSTVLTAQQVARHYKSNH